MRRAATAGGAAVRSRPHEVREPADPVQYLAWCLGIVAEAAATSRPCRCGALIPSRYSFADCTRCAMLYNGTSPEVVAWRAERRALARERIAALKAKLAEGDADA